MLEATFPEIKTFPGDLLSSDNTKFLQAALGKTKRVHYLSDNPIHFAYPEGVPSNAFRDGDLDGDLMDNVDRKALMKAMKISDLMDSSISRLFVAAHNAFDLHVPLALRPEVFWFTIVNQVAIFVKQNSDKYRHLFSKTTRGEKVTLTVRKDSLVYGSPEGWVEAIPLFRDQLAENMPAEMLEMFLPQFTASTPETEAAILVNFMDLVSQYYKFVMVSLCGIPNLRFEGTDADWQLLYDRTVELSQVVNIPGYFDDLLPVLKAINDGFVRGMDRNFLKSIYKVNEQSGGPYSSGWLTALNAYVVEDNGSLKLKDIFDWQGGRGYTTNQFPSHVAKVPMVWKYGLFKTYHMVLAAGIFGIGNSGGFLDPTLGVGVFEV